MLIKKHSNLVPFHKHLNLLSNIAKKEEQAMKKINKALILAARLGTRFLPATKARPKEILPIVDKPTI